MMSTAMLTTLFEFNQAMNNRLWAIISQHVTDAQFVQDVAYSRGSIRNQLVHMADAQRYWLRNLLGADMAPLVAGDYPTRDAARDVCQRTDQQTLDIVRGLSEAELERVADFWCLPVWAALLQMSHHSVDHRAQVLHLLTELGAPVFDQTLVVYMENTLPMTTGKLIDEITQKRALWDAALRQIPAARMDQPALNAWTVRDLVAILTWSDRQVADMVSQRVAADVSFSALPEAERAAILDASRALPLETLLEQHGAAHRDLLDAIGTLSDDVLNSDTVEGLPPDERYWKAIAPPTWWRYPYFADCLRPLVGDAPEG